MRDNGFSYISFEIDIIFVFGEITPLETFYYCGNCFIVLLEQFIEGLNRFTA